MSFPDLLNVTSRFEDIDVDKLAREEHAPYFDFTLIAGKVRTILGYIKTLNDDEDYWAQLPLQRQTQTTNALTQLADVLDQIRSYVPSDQSPQAQRDALIARFEDSYQQAFDAVFVPLLAHQSTKTESPLRKQILARVEESADLVTSIAEHREEVGRLLQEAQSALQGIQEASATAGVAAFAEIFRNQAADHQRRSRFWLGLSGVGTFGVAYLLWWTVEHLVDPAFGDTGEIVQVAVARILILFVAAGFLYQLFRQFAIQKHLFTLNKHRENSMSSFRAFYESTEDAATRDAVLIQVTKAIFEAGDTGYVHRDVGSGTIEVTQLLRRLGER